ncbi:hypothetical protein HD554DRAFT_2207065 [Boletus coccyginus]|nr:hypothetical protein HD554DRAFT_2207065 [Boletus coccyginus]
MAILTCAVKSTLVGAQVVPSQPSQETCKKITTSISVASEVYDFGTGNYFEDISHWASSSTQIAACSFEPGTLEDIGIAVKDGGHATNPGFSSTTGVQITMSRFSEVVYDAAAQTVTIGAGLIWDDVYAALEPHGVNVVGGRVSGVGVAGFTLGGGYSWLTNQYGLTIDTVQTFELVVPNGTAINVTATSSPDLFFTLKGGQNNFGIVTRFTLKTFPQTQVWGGVITYTADVLDQVNLATANFAANNTDPKAVIITSYNYLLIEASPFAAPSLKSDSTDLIIFYDAPIPPAGIFDEFLAIPSFTQSVSTRSFSSFVQFIPGTSATRAVFNSVSVTSYPLSFLQSIVNESIVSGTSLLLPYWGETLPKSVFLLSYDVEPFLPTLLDHNTTPSAYPPDRTQGFFPLNIYYAWLLPETDQDVYDAIRTSARTLQAHATDEGIANAVVYPNYAIFNTPLEDLYGTNLPRLQAIKAAVDPEDVMGHAGGFKI